VCDCRHCYESRCGCALLLSRVRMKQLSLPIPGSDNLPLKSTKRNVTKLQSGNHRLQRSLPSPAMCLAACHCPPNRERSGGRLTSGWAIE